MDFDLKVSSLPKSNGREFRFSEISPFRILNRMCANSRRRNRQRGILYVPAIIGARFALALDYKEFVEYCSKNLLY